MTRYSTVDPAGIPSAWECDWFYKGKPCTITGIDIEDGRPVALYVNTGVGPDIRAELADLHYQRRDN